MEAQGVERRLAAILAADAAGYGRRMEGDEEAAHCAPTACRKVIDGLLAKHRGRIFGSAGDSAIAELASPVEAGRRAVEIQPDLETRNADLPQDRRMKLTSVGD